MGEKGDIAGMYGAKRKEYGLKFEDQGLLRCPTAAGIRMSL